ncbi:MAG: DUF402 domain-containing protein [Chloroflexota bacterium]
MLWLPDQTIVLRNIAKSDGSVTTAIPAVVLQDDGRCLATLIAKGTPFMNNWVIPADQRVESVENIIPSAQRSYKDLIWRNHTIRLYLHGFGFSIWLNFDADNNFESWYGNLEAPFVKTPIGIDTRDYALDIVGRPDWSWDWKDRPEFDKRLELGVDSAEHQAWVLAQGQEFIRRFEARAWPFDQGWENWQPENEPAIRPLPDNWAEDFGSASVWEG